MLYHMIVTTFTTENDPASEILYIYIYMFVCLWNVAKNVYTVLDADKSKGVPQHSAREGGEVVSLTHRPPLPLVMFLVLIFNKGWVDPRAMERSEGDMSLKNPVTPPGIDPGTVRPVAQRLNHYATPLDPNNKETDTEYRSNVLVWC
jgi:hypothetical protein